MSRGSRDSCASSVDERKSEDERKQLLHVQAT
jgi:hypothetical protein